MKQLTRQLKSRLWENIFEDNGSQPVVELEVQYPHGHSYGWIDVVVRIGEWFILIENKILAGSKTNDQIHGQYLGLQKVLEQRDFQRGDYKILLLYVVPANGGEGGWSVPQAFYDELQKVELQPGDHKALISWQPVEDPDNEPISMVGTIRELLRLESLGMMAPFSVELRQILLSLVDYAMTGFQGYHYERATVKCETRDRKPVAQILAMEGDYYVGIQYGRAGLINAAWKNPDFMNAEMVVTENSGHGWQYLPLKEFKTLASWALDPEVQNLQGVEWTGKPFWIENLYRVAKWCKAEFYIGLKGGIVALDSMTAEQVKERKAWEVSSVQKSSQWIPAARFCEIVEAKGLSFA